MGLEYIFVYGVFRDAFHNMISDAVFCDRAFVYGKMYQVDQFYPGYVKQSCRSKVWGEVYLIVPEKFNELDKFEGPEYTRVKVWTSIGEECWIYEWNQPVDGFKEVECGDWLLR